MMTMEPIQVEGSAEQLMEATKSTLLMYADWVQGALFQMEPKPQPDDLFFLTIIKTPNRFSFVLVRKDKP